MPFPTTPKTELIDLLARVAGLSETEVRQRVRVLSEAGLAPFRIDTLYDGHVANIILGLLASPGHREAADVVQRVGQFRLIAVEPTDLNAGKFFDRLFPEGRVIAGRDFLAAVLRGLAEQAPFHVGYIAADFAPHDDVRIQILPSGSGRIDLTFGPETRATRRLRPAQVWPMRQTQTFDGHVLAAIAPFGTPDLFKGDDYAKLD